MNNINNRYIGKKLEGRYLIQEMIGIGGMAEVYKAFDVLDKKDVAVKVLKDEYLSNEDFKRRFRNESKAISVLSHENIVKIFDVSFGDTIQFIVMEYVDGVTLKEYIEQQKEVPWKESVHFILQILKALQHAHDNGIVHRDIKPQNVMILRDGTVKVMDFGIARFARDNGRTISEKAIGSVHYISPEQAKGEVTDEKTDIYSVGVILFEMLTGQLPFDGDTPVAVAIKQMQIEPEKPRKINPAIPEGLEEIIIRAMKKDIDLRYQTAAEMLRDVEEFKRNPSILFEYKYFTNAGNVAYMDKIKENKYTKNDKTKKRKMSPTIQILLGITIVALMIIGVALYIFFTGLEQQNGEEIYVYDLVGLSYEEVIKDESYNDLEIVKSSEEMSDEYEDGIIIEQSPSANKNVKVGSKITVVVSSGLNKAVVPDVSGLTEEEAKIVLELEGFVIDEDCYVSKFSSDVDEGLVINTNPEAGTEVKKSQDIKIYVSSGTAVSTVSMPQLVGLTEEQAQEKLLSYGLKYGVTVQVNSSEPKGTVVNQSVAAESTVNEGTTIEIQVSNGVASTTELEVTIPFSSKVIDEKVEFEIYLDGTAIDTIKINPYEEDLVFTVEESGEKILTIQVDKQNYARYTINFDEGTIEQIGSTNSSLLQAVEEEEEEEEEEDTSSNSDNSDITSSDDDSTTSDNSDTSSDDTNTSSDDESEE